MKPDELQKGKTPKELGLTVQNISIDLTENCSLRCTYCFADIGTCGKTGNNILSYKTGMEIMTLFKKLNKEGKTIILITHDLKLVRYGKRIIKLADGKVMGSKKWN